MTVIKNLVKIQNVHLYTGVTDAVKDCERTKNFLSGARIKFTELHYADFVDHHKATFDALSTWSFGPDNYNKEFKNFPILIWDECFDDWSSHRHAAHGLKEIEASNLIKNLHLVERVE